MQPIKHYTSNVTDRNTQNPLFIYTHTHTHTHTLLDYLQLKNFLESNLLISGLISHQTNLEDLEMIFSALFFSCETHTHTQRERERGREKARKRQKETERV